MQPWEQFEIEVLDALGDGAKFQARQVAQSLGIETWEVTGWIQRYLRAQRRTNSKTKYALSRTGQTSATVWAIGVRTQDARNVAGQFGDDVRTRVRRAVAPDLRRIGELNPRALPAIEGAIEPAVDSLVKMVESLFVVAGWDGSEA